MLTTDFTPGAPNWLDLGSPDTEASVGFYRAVLGWTFDSAGPEAGGYGFFRNQGKIVAALGPLTEEGATPAWTIYFNTPDADATAKTVIENGGTVRVAPGDVFTHGRMAAFTDPEGAQFAVWQPGDTAGLEQVTEPGSLGWTEVYVPEPDAVRSFYAEVLGWRIVEQPFGEGLTYILCSLPVGEQSEVAGIMPAEPGDRAHWLPYFEVPDVDATIARAEAHGAMPLMPSMDVEGVGRFAVLTDPHGARFALITSAAAE
ncbi:VOC family protein [Acrocarpospora catenulata]|uniref:VOC family protein n=1 Tax=Acrocarpospora catenulata TaxID=2836182 RepID=UPI001BDB5F25|nr:VOC family protein [Acrocarpospora catenulata]